MISISHSKSFFVVDIIRSATSQPLSSRFLFAVCLRSFFKFGCHKEVFFHLFLFFFKFRDAFFFFQSLRLIFENELENFFFICKHDSHSNADFIRQVVWWILDWNLNQNMILSHNAFRILLFWDGKTNHLTQQEEKNHGMAIRHIASVCRRNRNIFACFNDGQETCTELHFVRWNISSKAKRERKKTVWFQVMW